MSAPKARKIRVGDRLRWRRDGTLWRVRRVGNAAVQMVSLNDGIGMWVHRGWLHEWSRTALRVRTRDLAAILRDLERECVAGDCGTFKEMAAAFLRIARKRARG